MTIPLKSNQSMTHVNTIPEAAQVPKLPLWGSVILFAIPTICLWLATRIGIPWLQERIAGPDILCWFVAGGLVFFGLFVAAIIGFWIEKRRLPDTTFATRFRFRPVTRSDVIYTLVALAICSLASGVIFVLWMGIAGLTTTIGPPKLTPPFIQMEPVTQQTLWVLAAWLPLFFFNITGEELWWRGYILPRQEQEHGKPAWLVHAAGLTLFHLPLGVDLAILLLPFLAALPWVVQKRQNLWTGFLFHGLLNGGGFLAVAFWGWRERIFGESVVRPPAFGWGAVRWDRSDPQAPLPRREDQLDS